MLPLIAQPTVSSVDKHATPEFEVTAVGIGGGDTGGGGEDSAHAHIAEAPEDGFPAWPSMPYWQQKLVLPQQSEYPEPEQVVELLYKVAPAQKRPSVAQ